jgi:hypothetical protein
MKDSFDHIVNDIDIRHTQFRHGVLNVAGELRYEIVEWHARMNIVYGYIEQEREGSETSRAAASYPVE